MNENDNEYMMNVLNEAYIESEQEDNDEENKNTENEDEDISNNCENKNM